MRGASVFVRLAMENLRKRSPKTAVGAVAKRFKSDVADGEKSSGDATKSESDAAHDTKASVVPESGRRLEATVNPNRVRCLTKTTTPAHGSAVVYWMSRDQRVQDNWAMLYAQERARALSCALVVVFNVVPTFLEATERQYGFMLKGLSEVEADLHALGIGFQLLTGDPRTTVPAACVQLRARLAVVDFSPVRIQKAWAKAVALVLESSGIPFFQVDAHNVVPCWLASDKCEYAARTIRTKLHTRMEEYLTEYPRVVPHPVPSTLSLTPSDWKAADASLTIDRTVKESPLFVPGYRAGMASLARFCGSIGTYGSLRNDPTKDAQSGLSPYFHFGQISPQRCILAALGAKRANGRSKEAAAACDAFVEECLVRRELSDNFCYYNEAYDTIEGASAWARETLAAHSRDPREFVYEEGELERGETHDRLWNAAQLQMVRDGKMHGFLRMYWAKKILEWTASPEDALRIAIRQNDRYEIDGRDPNGYVGCMWSIAGVHDMGWAERPVFGKVRYMNYAGCKRKFNVDAFIARYPSKTTAQAAAVKRAGALYGKAKGKSSYK